MTKEEQVVFLLKTKEMTGREIFNSMSSKSGPVSRQSIYNILSKLLKQEVVVKQATKYSLNYVWLMRLNEFTNIARQKSTFTFHELDEGEKITYRFQNLEKTSTFWMHTFQVLYNRMPLKSAVPIYSSHEWTDIVRPDQDKEWREIVANGPNLVLFSIGDSSKLNKDYAKKYSHKNLVIHSGKTYGFSKGYYLNVFGDYLVEVRVPESLALLMDKLFVKQGDRRALKSSLIFGGLFNKKITLTIRRNKVTAQKLYRRLTKDYFIPKGFRSASSGLEAGKGKKYL